MSLFLKVMLACIAALLLTLGWYALSLRNVIRQQNAQIRELQTAVADQSQKQAHGAQLECAASAEKFLSTRGWKPEDGSEYENHFNARFNKCFVLISTYLLKDDFRSIDLYDAVEGRRYATYVGHNICDVSITGNPKKCMLDGGSIWFDGNDSRHPPDFNVGFRGLRYGGGAGDATTQQGFTDRVHMFMNQ